MRRLFTTWHKSHGDIDCSRRDDYTADEVDEIVCALDRRDDEHEQVQEDRTISQPPDWIKSPYKQNRPCSVKAREGNEARQATDERVLAGAYCIEVYDLIGTHHRR